MRAPAQQEALLDVEGVAARLNLSVRHVRRLVVERRIPFLKVGSLLRFDPAQIDVWLGSLAVCGVDRLQADKKLSHPPRLAPVRQPQVRRSAARDSLGRT